jgi:hypothetical protein
MATYTSQSRLHAGQNPHPGASTAYREQRQHRQAPAGQAKQSESAGHDGIPRTAGRRRTHIREAQPRCPGVTRLPCAEGNNTLRDLFTGQEGKLAAGMLQISSMSRHGIAHLRVFRRYKGRQFPIDWCRWQAEHTFIHGAGPEMSVPELESQPYILPAESSGGAKTASSQPTSGPRQLPLECSGWSSLPLH